MGCLGVGIERHQPDTVIAGRILDLPLLEVVGRDGFCHLFPFLRARVIRHGLGSIHQAFGPEHRPVMRSPFGEVEDKIGAF